MAAPSPLFAKAKAERPVRRQLTKEEQEGILYAFETLDSEKTGLLTAKHLKVALRAMGFSIKKATVREMITKQGLDEDAKLDYNTFKALVADKLQDRTLLDEYKRAFQLFDVLGSGAIDLPTLKKIIRSLNLDIREDELQDMIHEFDLDKDGAINEQEFLAIMTAGDF